VADHRYNVGMNHSYSFICRGCSAPIPIETTDGESPTKFSITAGTLQIVCPHCKGAFEYQRTEVALLHLEASSMSAYMATINCNNAGCKNLYRAYFLLPDGAHLDERVHATLMNAKPAVQCPLGHELKGGSNFNYERLRQGSA
jgi:hypothetical protein